MVKWRIRRKNVLNHQMESGCGAHAPNKYPLCSGHSSLLAVFRFLTVISEPFWLFNVLSFFLFRGIGLALRWCFINSHGSFLNHAFLWCVLLSFFSLLFFLLSFLSRTLLRFRGSHVLCLLLLHLPPLIFLHLVGENSGRRHLFAPPDVNVYPVHWLTFE
ncbi:hypothetical protein BLNAU_3709 [Blattamonas nauphoetae]|uniref:Transmembrane protein n=1 Tax=Blattamonas nauphoetae TaxID=2049346 RepID=A0ABQ9YBW5_9EUKA|nr:hypothetical protein BLNAU_3709 [Blattamonas nauphoetae]